MFLKVNELADEKMASNDKSFELFAPKKNVDNNNELTYEQLKKTWLRTKNRIDHIIINNINSWDMIKKFMNDDTISIREKMCFLNDLGFDESYYPTIEKNSLKEMREYIDNNPKECDDEKIYCLKRDDVSLYNEYYSKDEIIKVSNIINEIVERVGVPQKGNEEEELRCVLKTFEEIAYIRYDNYLVNKDSKNDARRVACHNLLGLIRGKTICFGYSRISREIFNQLGIENHLVKSKQHAWLQVKIGEKWQNVDFTFDRDKIAKKGYALPEILQTSEQFNIKHSPWRYKRETMEYPSNIPLGEEICSKIAHEKRGIGINNIIKRIVRDEKIAYENIDSDRKRIMDIAKQYWNYGTYNTPKKQDKER